MSDALLLDTHVALWLSSGSSVREAVRRAVREAVASGAGIHLSPITAWEAALLLRRGRIKIAGSAGAWFRRLHGLRGFRIAELSADLLVASVDLPGDPPRDPADCILVATARELGLTLVTRDRLILSYGEQGHVRTLRC